MSYLIHDEDMFMANVAVDECLRAAAYASGRNVAEEFDNCSYGAVAYDCVVLEGLWLTGSICPFNRDGCSGGAFGVDYGSDVICDAIDNNCMSFAARLAGKGYLLSIAIGISIADYAFGYSYKAGCTLFGVSPFAFKFTCHFVNVFFIFSAGISYSDSTVGIFNDFNAVFIIDVVVRIKQAAFGKNYVTADIAMHSVACR